jgi:hypothetical protein
MHNRLNSRTFLYGLDWDPTKAKSTNLKPGLSDHDSFHISYLDKASLLGSGEPGSMLTAVFHQQQG